jgi:hypothetical protein
LFCKKINYFCALLAPIWGVWLFLQVWSSTGSARQATEKQQRAVAVPSLGREGQDEGERYPSQTNISTVPAAKNAENTKALNREIHEPHEIKPLRPALPSAVGATSL